MTAKPTFKEIEAWNRTLSELYPVPVVISRLTNGTLVWANQAFFTVFGYTRQDVDETTITLETDPEERRRLIAQLRRQGRVREFDIHYRAKRDGVFSSRIAADIISLKGRKCLLCVVTFCSPLQMPPRQLQPHCGDRFSAILQNIAEGYYEVDLKGSFTFFNQAMLDITGYPAGELMGLNYRAYTNSLDSQRLRAVFKEVFRSGGTGRIVDYAIVRKNGTQVLVESSASLLRGPSGRPTGFYGVVRDRTGLKRAEEALRESEESYRHLLELAPDSISVTRIRDGRFLQVNRTFCKRTGYRLEEVIGRTVHELNIYAQSEQRGTIIERLQKHGRIEGMEVRFRMKDGRIVYNMISARSFKFRNEECLLLISTNIEALKQAQWALRRSEEKYRQVLETMEEGYYEIDLAGNYTYFNEATRRHHGCSTEELMGMNYRRYLFPARAAENRKVFNEVYRTGIPVKISDYEIIRKDGTVLLGELSGYPLKNSEGQTIGFWGISRDRTEQKKAEMALHKSEEQYRLLVENANDGIFITQEGRIKFLNRKTTVLTGFSQEELAGMDFSELVHPEDKALFESHRRKLEERHWPELFSFRILNKGKEALWVDLSVIGINWEGRPAALNFLRDISLQKRMESLLLQSRKMEAVGTLAGGIAHDFNNLLMGIQGNTSLALMDVDKQHPVYDMLKNIEQYVRAGADLTKQLLGAAKGGKYEVRPTDLNKVVAASGDLFGRTHKEITIHRKLSEALWTVEVDRGQIEQVLLNLYVNSRHAMPEGGDLFLETINVTLDEHYVRPYGVQAGRYVKVSVTDSGSGIDPKDQKRIFDPFYTTKGRRRGTGLGLASAYGIITNHGGIITVYSELGSGATFNIYLPASARKNAHRRETKPQILSGSETILFVDDEKGIVEVGRRILERLGYTVISAGGGAEAVSIYRREHPRIDLVLLDMIMPGMGGGETFNELKAIDPDVRVILSSGYSINGQAKGILERGCKGFIQKPFSMQDLSAKLREVLDDKE